MKLSQKIMSVLLAALMALPLLPVVMMEASAAKSFENSDFIETEQPELSEETKKLISLYQKNPTEENYLNLRDMVIENYNAVLDRKEAKLAELKAETDGKPGGEEKVAEMEEIVQEMYITYWNRINSSMLRFTDTRLLKWKIADAPKYEYIPVMGAGESIYVKRTPVTNKEYAAFVKATGAQAPKNWTNGTYPKGEDNYPVNFVSYEDAEAYCAWLTKQDGVNTYRLPNESEWELAAGHMPKDADFNCDVTDGRTPVEQYEGVTRGAHGAIDFWGNVWEWTSTVRSDADGITTLGVKGGSWCSERTECRTEHRKEGRDAAAGYEDVGFRVIQVLNGEEPEQKVELATLGAPVVSAASTTPDSITLSWRSVEGAVEYQLFEYFENTGLLQMLDTVKGTSVTMSNLEPGSTHSYIVQPISYVEIADNVSPENSVRVTCGNSSFTDVPANAYYAEAVAWSMEHGITGGTSATTFSPDSICSRAQLVTFLWRASGSPTPASTSHPFTDVSSDAYYYQAILWAVENGITSGTSPATFSPDATVNRGQAVTFLYRVAGSPAVNAANPFVDVAADAYYANAALWAAEREITVGTTATTFSSLDNCTRAQTVVFLYRYFTGSMAPANMKLYETGEMDYWLYTPENENENMPLIVYLHGSSGKGDDPASLLNIDEFPKYLAEGTLGEIPAYVLIPQLPEGQGDWISRKETVVEIIHQVVDIYGIDSENISLTGFSMGGTGAWNIAVSYPDLFCRIAPCSGSIRTDAETLSALSQMEIWTFIATEDTAVKPQPTIDFIKQLTQINSQVFITAFEGAVHTDVPALAFLSDEIALTDWLIEK